MTWAACRTSGSEGPRGSFKVALAEFSQVEVVRVVGVTQVDWGALRRQGDREGPGRRAIRGRWTEGAPRAGRRAGVGPLPGDADRPGRGVLAHRRERRAAGADVACCPGDSATPPPAAIAPLPAPRPEPVPEDPQALLTVDDSNAQKVLGMFFDFDKADIRPDAEEGLETQRGMAQAVGLPRRSRVEGYGGLVAVYPGNTTSISGRERADAARQITSSRSVCRSHSHLRWVARRSPPGVLRGRRRVAAGRATAARTS